MSGRTCLHPDNSFCAWPSRGFCTRHGWRELSRSGARLLEVSLLPSRCFSCRRKVLLGLVYVSARCLWGKCLPRISVEWDQCSYYRHVHFCACSDFCFLCNPISPASAHLEKWL